MDSYEATRIVFSRITNLDPENASKIMGLLLIQDHGDKELIRLALGPDAFLHSVILKARKDLGLMPVSNSHSFFGNGGPDRVVEEEFELPDQISFLDDGACSVSDVCFDDPNATGFGWKPCLYYDRGYSKNGGGCRFLHGDGLGELGGSLSKFEMMDGSCHEALLRSKSTQHQRLAAASQLMRSANSFPYSSKCMNFVLQQQDTDARRAAAALMNGEDIHKFSRSPRLERNEFAMMNGAGMVHPASRQIYLTFPADSSFREEDVSNYFSIYGPVEDVRIPYQQKRMFGFVTFVFPETVKLILAKGNPHFVCDATVLVKPYKEKGKIHDRKQQGEIGDLSPCGAPTVFDGRDSYDLQLGERVFYNSEDMWRRKVEEQAELQQALEFQSRRLMGLQLLDVKKHHCRALSANSPINSPMQSPSMFNQDFRHSSFHSQEVTQGNCERPVTSSSALLGDQQPEKIDTVAMDKVSATNSNCSGSCKESPRDDEKSDLLGNLEHNLPDSPFASPTKGAQDYLSAFPALAGAANEMTSLKSVNLQIPRLSSGHGTIEMYSSAAAGPKCPVGTS